MMNTMTTLRFALLALGWLVTSTRAQIGCLFTMEQLIIQEQFVADYNVLREYTVCNNRIWNVGEYDINNDLIPNSGSKPFPLRPNLHVKCGTSGERENSCVINGGDVQVDGTNFWGREDDGSNLENIILEGFTFTAANRYSVWAIKGGSITFIDCEWKEITGAYAPLYFDYFNPEDPNSYLDIAFIGCSFTNNIYFGDGAYPAIIIANGDQNRLSIERSDFENNDYVFNNTQFAKNSYLIEASGELRLQRNCFINNKVGVSPAASFGAVAFSESNYGDASDGDKCAFLSNFETLQQYQDTTPNCEGFEVTNRCESSSTSIPSIPPTEPPSRVPSESPSLTPTVTPTMFPSDQPSLLPTLSGSQVPTDTPTTSMPSNTAPSGFPSLSPSTTEPSSPPSDQPSGAPVPTLAPVPTPLPTPAPTLAPVPVAGLAPPVGSGATTISACLAAFVVAVAAIMV